MHADQPHSRKLRPAVEVGDAGDVVDIVILGAGYAGQMVAARLAQKRLPVRVTVVEPSPVFVERIRLHQVAAGRPPSSVPMRELLPRSVDWIQARAERIDAAQRLVHLAGDGAPATLRYDVLVYALGSRDDLDAVPGARQFARGLGTADTAAAVAAEVSALAARGGEVLVVGGGLTGIETAAELAERHRGLRITLASAGPLGPSLHEHGRAHLARVFDRLGVIRREHARITAVEQGRALLADGSALRFDLCLWTAGFRAPPLARRSGLPCNHADLLEVDATLRVRDHANVFAAGDAAVIAGGPALRMACAVAMPMGAHVGDEVARLVRGEPSRPFRFAFAGQSISLGRRDGLVQVTDAEDRPTARIIRGRKARWIKETVWRYALWAVRAERRGVRLMRWPQPPVAPARALAAAPGESA